VRELPMAINDDPFGALAADELLSLLALTSSAEAAKTRPGRPGP